VKNKLKEKSVAVDAVVAVVAVVVVFYGMWNV